MTYCVGLQVDTGLVLLSDSRTNAGVDQINTFRKMTTFQHAPDRALVLLSAGNLGITQAVVNLLETPDEKYPDTRLLTVTNMFDAARVVGDALREIHLSVGPPLDLAIIKRDEFKLATHISIDIDNEYFKMLRERWGFALQAVFNEIPNPTW